MFRSVPHLLLRGAARPVAACPVPNTGACGKMHAAIAGQKDLRPHSFASHHTLPAPPPFPPPPPCACSPSLPNADLPHTRRLSHSHICILTRAQLTSPPPGRPTPRTNTHGSTVVRSRPPCAMVGLQAAGCCCFPTPECHHRRRSGRRRCGEGMCAG